MIITVVQNLVQACARPFPEKWLILAENNRIRAYHLGLSGQFFRRMPYKLMLTCSQNYGRFRAPYAGESAWGKPWGTVHETSLWQFSAAFVGEVPSRLGTNLALKKCPPSVESLFVLKPE